MAVLDRAIKTAERLIAKYGQPVVWKTVTDGVPVNPGMPWKPSEAADSSHNVIICFLPVDKESRQLYAYLRGTDDIPNGHTLGYMKGNIGFDPSLKDTVIRDGKTLRIKTLDLLSPNGQKVLYIMELEG